jgi:23S rRNA-/tRNA-specific pseudouridylate synthase
MNPEELLQRLLYRDGLMLIIDKPAGLPVHAGPGGGANLERHLDALRFGRTRPPWPIGWTAIPAAAWCWGGSEKACPA